MYDTATRSVDLILSRSGPGRVRVHTNFAGDGQGKQGRPLVTCESSHTSPNGMRTNP